MKIVIFCATIAFCQFSFAQIYQWKDDKGITHFSDSQPKDTSNVAAVDLKINSPIQLPKPVLQEKTPDRAPNNVIYLSDKNSSYNECQRMMWKAKSTEEHLTRFTDTNDWKLSDCK